VLLPERRPMSNRLFVGNLPYDATEEDLRVHFAQAGSVSSVFIPLDRETGRPRGFAFVEFDDPEHASAAISTLHQKPFRDRPLVINEARPNESRPPGGGRPPFSGPRPPSSGGRPPGPPRTGPPGAGFGEEGRDKPQARRPTVPRPRRRPGKRTSWEEGPRKEPIPEKRRSQFFGGFDEPEEDEADSDFENFATGMPDTGEDEG
jgi:RNA recognition motif-containing protein